MPVGATLSGEAESKALTGPWNPRGAVGVQVSGPSPLQPRAPMPPRSSLVRSLVLALTLMAGAATAVAQQPAAPPADTTQNAALRVFLDCDGGCDSDFMRTEMTWVNWMRERLDADFHILVTSQQTGSGGREWAIVAIGQRAFAGRTDTLHYVSNPNDASDTIRRGLLRAISQLLVPYAARGPLGSRLNVTYTPLEGAAATSAPANDRWDFWTYSISANGFMDGESRQSFRELWTDLSANRTTEAWKIRVNANTSYGQSEFSYDTGAPPVKVTTTSIRRSSNASAMAVKSLGDHWSAGARGIVSQTVFNNLDLATQVSAAVEWDLWPYKDYTRRRFTVLYTAGIRDLNYNEETIYGKLSETRPVHTLDATLGARQPWGSANVTLFGSQYLDGLKYYNLGIRGGVEVRVGRGLSFNVDGQLSRVRNQLYLPGGGLTPEEVLLRQQALATNYRYFTFFGIRYQFGSIFNNVVNPRFGNINGIDDF